MRSFTENARGDRGIAGARRLARAEALRCAERIDDGHTVEPIEQAALHVGAEQHTRRRDRAQRRQVPAVGCGAQRVEQRAGEHVADDGERLHALARDGVPDPFGIETGVVHEHDGAAPGERGDGGEEAGPVHQRCRGEQRRCPLARAGSRPRIGRLGGAGMRRRPERDVQVVVAPHHALGCAGRAAGVEEDQVVARRGAGRPLDRWRGRGQGPLVRLAGLEQEGPGGRRRGVRWPSARWSRTRLRAPAPGRRSCRAGSGARGPGSGS